MKPIILLVLISLAIFSLPVCATAMPDREKDKDYLRKPKEWDKKVIPFNMRGQSWTEVLKWFADESGCRIIAQVPLPAGSFTFVNPGAKLGAPRMYSLLEVFDLINETLQGSTKISLLRRGSDIVLVSVDGPMPNWQFSHVELRGLPKYGRTEIAIVTMDMENEFVAGQVKRLLGEFGHVVRTQDGRYSARRTVQSLMLVAELLADREAEFRKLLA